MTVHDLPTFPSTLEVLAKFALSTGRLVKVHLSLVSSKTPQIIPFPHIPSTIPGSGGQGLFGEADAEAIGAEPDLERATDAMGMDVEDDAEGMAATADGRNDS